MPRVACDSLVALRGVTADGTVLFAKNSDRPAHECQPLLQVPRQVHGTGSHVRCTYIEIPQVRETARLIGSRPFWSWGLEHGLNEHGVAIGNHTVFTKDTLGAVGLTGMDLVRLGLERSATAEQAVRVMTGLIATHGQGGSGYHDKDWPYHNSFLIADRQAAFVLETSDRYWALRHVDGAASVSNHLSIGDDWDEISTGAMAHAIAAGWWRAASDERFDFAAAYRDTSVAPEAISSGRLRRTRALLDERKGMISVALLRAALRDHYGQVEPGYNCTPADPQYFSVCMHAEPVGTTTASLIARIPPRSDGPLTYWASLGAPCVGAFIPLYVDGDLPAVLSRGGERPADDSPWWMFRRLLVQVEQDWARRAPHVRQRLDQFEADVAKRMQAVDTASSPAAARAAFMEATVAELLTHVRCLTAEWAGAEGAGEDGQEKRVQ
ncbi:MAG: secernin-3 [Candidatus Binatia bacterium]